MLWTRKRRGGSRQSRLVPMSQSVRELLVQLSHGKGNNTYVFTNPRTGEAYHKLQPCVRYLLKRLCDKANVKEFGYHSIRHYTAQQLLQVNVRMGDIQASRSPAGYDDRYLPAHPGYGFEAHHPSA